MKSRNIWWKTAKQRGYPIESTVNGKAYVAITPTGIRRVVYWYGNETKAAQDWLKITALHWLPWLNIKGGE